MLKVFVYILVFMALLLGQVSLIPIFASESSPDIVLIGIVVLGVREGGVDPAGVKGGHHL